MQLHSQLVASALSPLAQSFGTLDGNTAHLSSHANTLLYIDSLLPPLTSIAAQCSEPPCPSLHQHWALPGLAVMLGPSSCKLAARKRHLLVPRGSDRAWQCCRVQQPVSPLFQIANRYTNKVGAQYNVAYNTWQHP